MKGTIAFLVYIAAIVAANVVTQYYGLVPVNVNVLGWVHDVNHQGALFGGGL